MHGGRSFLMKFPRVKRYRSWSNLFTSIMLFDIQAREWIPDDSVGNDPQALRICHSFLLHCGRVEPAGPESERSSP